jgi:hypothetical protein
MVPPHGTHASRDRTVMRRFLVERDEDVSGISGTGVVAEGIQFSDGSVVLRWRGAHSSTVVWATVSAAHAVHGHDGRTRFTFLD